MTGGNRGTTQGYQGQTNGGNTGSQQGYQSQMTGGNRGTQGYQGQTNSGGQGNFRGSKGDMEGAGYNPSNPFREFGHAIADEAGSDLIDDVMPGKKKYP